MALQLPPPATALGSTPYPHRRYHGALSEVRYAHPDGDNSRDGLTWGTAKATILAAYDTLPATGGTIYFADLTSVGGEVANQGLWLAGTLDPNWASLPAGWRQVKPLRLIGVGTHNDGGHAPPAARILSGSSSDVAKPGLWTSGGMNGLHIENADFGNLAQPFLLGKSSTGASDTNNPSAVFRNVHGRVNQVAGYGPVWDLWSTYWVWWEHCGTASNEQEVYTSDKRAAFLVRGSAIGAGLLYISDHQFSGGAGVKYYGAGGVQLVIERCVQEGVTTGGQIEAPVVWVVDSIGTSSGNIIARNIEMSDSVGGEPAVRVAAGNDPASVIVQGVNSVIGPATVSQLYPLAGSFMPSPAKSRQVGIVSDRLSGVYLPPRMAFSPTVARYANRAPQTVASWSTGGAITVTGSQAGPDGSTNAGKITATSFGESTVTDGGQTLSVGDWFFAGVWARSEVAGAVPLSPLLAGSVNTNNDLNDTTDNSLTASLKFTGTSWEWLSVGGKFTSIGTPSSALTLRLRSDLNKTMFYCYPILIYVPSGTITDDEAWEILDSLATYPDATITAGSITTMRGQDFYAQNNLIQPGLGTYHEFKENGTADAAAGAANTFRLFARDNGSGKTQMCVRFNTGDVQVLATEA